MTPSPSPPAMPAMPAMPAELLLLPCPFCGGSAELVGVGAWNKCSAAYCDNCEIYGPMMATKETGAFAWNRRPALSRQEQSVDPGNLALIRKEVLRCLLEHAINGKALAICEPENTYIREAYAALKVDSAITALSTLSRQSGRWMPWKPGDALPADGMYALAVMFPDGEWHRRVAKPASFADWYDIELRYWSIPLQNDPDLPPAYGADQIGGCP